MKHRLRLGECVRIAHLPTRAATPANHRVDPARVIGPAKPWGFPDVQLWTVRFDDGEEACVYAHEVERCEP